MLNVTIGDPLTAGALTLFPLFTQASPAPDYVVGPLAWDTGTIQVTEDGEGQVPFLIATNLGATPVLFVEGELILGGLQNRTVAASVLLPAAARAEVSVRCVEAGRWNDPVAHHRSPRHAPSCVRRVMADQSQVWATVDAFAVPSETSALEDVFEARPDDTTSELRAPEGSSGLMVAVGGRIVGMDLFDRPTTLQALWDGLVAAASLEAGGRDDVACPSDDAEAFLAQVMAAARTHEQSSGLGERARFDDGRVTGSCLTWEGAVVHLAAVPA